MSDTSRDPSIRHSLTEARAVAWIVVVSFTVSITVSYVMGYRDDGTLPPMILGVPTWVFWGVFVPWLGATAVSGWFAMTRMVDDPLEDEIDA